MSKPKEEKLKEIQALLKEGNAGVNAEGKLVDRREDPTAIPVVGYSKKEVTFTQNKDAY